jgi:uncharacterized protein DUF1573
MPDDFGTVSTRRGDRTREIEILRQHYGRHRDALARLIPDAPTERLAMEYQRLVAEIDASLRKLDEMEGRAPTSPGTLADTNPAFKTATAPGTTAPGTRPLMRTQEAPTSGSMYEPMVGAAPQSRLMLIVVAGVVVLGLLMWLIWRASSDRKGPTPIVEQRPAVTSTTAPPPAITPAPPTAPALKVAPALADYGTIRKGTRAVRQFEITNTTDRPVQIQVARSACRCLFYDYNGKLAPRGKETITVTIDGARAKAGVLQEQLDVTAKKDPSVRASFAVQATIR